MEYVRVFSAEIIHTHTYTVCIGKKGQFSSNDFSGVLTVVRRCQGLEREDWLNGLDNKLLQQQQSRPFDRHTKKGKNGWMTEVNSKNGGTVFDWPSPMYFQQQQSASILLLSLSLLRRLSRSSDWRLHQSISPGDNFYSRKAKFDSVFPRDSLLFLGSFLSKGF